MSRGLFAVLEEINSYNTPNNLLALETDYDLAREEFNSYIRKTHKLLDKLNTASNDLNTISKMQNIISKSRNNLSKESYRIMAITLEAIDPVIYTQSPFYRATDNQLALEGIGEFLTKIWEAIKKAVMYVVNFIKGLFGKSKVKKDKQRLYVDGLINEVKDKESKKYVIKDEESNKMTVYENQYSAYTSCNKNELLKDINILFFKDGKTFNSVIPSIDEINRMINDFIDSLNKEEDLNFVNNELAKEIDKIVYTFHSKVNVNDFGKHAKLGIIVEIANNGKVDFRTSYIIRIKYDEDKNEISVTTPNLHEIITTLSNLKTSINEDERVFANFIDKFKQLEKTINSHKGLNVKKGTLHSDTGSTTETVKKIKLFITEAIRNLSVLRLHYTQAVDMAGNNAVTICKKAISYYAEPKAA